MANPLRVGIGYDIHRFAEGRRLVLGGVEVPYSRGLIGHSDADVVLHAVTDAVLGAAGLPDIGELFPDTDPAYKDADSRGLLTTAIEKVRARGLNPGNVDLIIHAEAPKLSSYKRAMAESIAKLMGMAPDTISVKAKTNEGMGPVGSADAIACTAIALLEKTDE